MQFTNSVPKLAVLVQDLCGRPFSVLKEGDTAAFNWVDVGRVEFRILETGVFCLVPRAGYVPPEAFDVGQGFQLTNASALPLRFEEDPDRPWLCKDATHDFERADTVRLELKIHNETFNLVALAEGVGSDLIENAHVIGGDKDDPDSGTDKDDPDSGSGD